VSVPDDLIAALNARIHAFTQGNPARSGPAGGRRGPRPGARPMPAIVGRSPWRGWVRLAALVPLLGPAGRPDQTICAGANGFSRAGRGPWGRRGPVPGGVMLRTAAYLLAASTSAGQRTTPAAPWSSCSPVWPGRLSAGPHWSGTGRNRRPLSDGSVWRPWSSGTATAMPGADLGTGAQPLCDSGTLSGTSAGKERRRMRGRRAVSAFHQRWPDPEVFMVESVFYM